MAKRPVRILIALVCLSLVAVSSSVFAVRADPSYYPFKATFENDLVKIASTDCRIMSLQVVQILDIARSVVVGMDYAPSDLSNATRIVVQDEVQAQLGALSYVEWVGRDGYVSIPENKTPPPWPGFVIGKLIVTFVDNPSDPVAHPWPDDSKLVASNVGMTDLTLSWSKTKENSSIVSYQILEYYDPIVTVSNTTHSYSVTGLNAGTVYTFRVEAVNDAGNLRLGPTTTVTTREKASGTQPPNTQPPATITDTRLSIILSTSWLSSYLQLLLVGLTIVAITGLSVVAFKRRS